MANDLPEHEQWRADPLKALDDAVAFLDGEDRPGQRLLAEAVSDAIRRGHHVVAAAPTGSGKSLAYLAPAVASGLRVVVATATIALQDQLSGKDIPQLAAATGVRFRAVTLKGRANYVCRAKLRTADGPDALFEIRPGTAFGAELDVVRRFAEESPTGDRADLPEDISDASWAACSCSGQECPGARACEDGPTCFAEAARAAAVEADIVVVNHALTCLDVEAAGQVLPPHDVLIVDEAHALQDAATRSFGADLSPAALRGLATLLGRHGAAEGPLTALRRSAEHLEGLLGPVEGQRVVEPAGQSIRGSLQAAAEHLVAARSGLSQSETPEARRAHRLATTRLETIRRMGEDRPGDVLWVEGRGERVTLRLAPIEVGEALARHLLTERPVVLVSATLGGPAPFTDFARSIGLDPAAEPGRWGSPPDRDADPEEVTRETGRGYVALEVPTTFSWREQGTLYVDPTLPDPARERDAWLEAAAGQTVQLVEAAGGRSLVLCTSRGNVDRFADALEEAELGIEILRQGATAPAELTRRFLADERSVLVGTRTFWAGLDAPGSACVLVVIDRIPFPVPSEPLHAARREHAERAGLDAFNTVDVPAAALTLAQGAGRLLRRREDRGVVAVLDPRLATRSYRRALLAAMPPLRRTVDLTDACAALVASIDG